MIDDLLRNLTQPLHTELHRLSGAKITRWFESRTHAGGCAGGNQVPRTQCHEAAQIANHMRNTKNHL